MDQEQPSDHVNDYVAQVGGDHYGSVYGHWDWVITTKLGYLEACATKYLSRWKNKDGIKDLKKALSYIQKIKAAGKGYPPPFLEVDEKAFEKFCETYTLSWSELKVCRQLISWSRPEHLDYCIDLMKGIIVTAQEAAQGQAAQMGAKGRGKGYHAALCGTTGQQPVKDRRK